MALRDMARLLCAYQDMGQIRPAQSELVIKKYQDQAIWAS
jgi:hypothetical protein